MRRGRGKPPPAALGAFQGTLQGALSQNRARCAARGNPSRCYPKGAASGWWEPRGRARGGWGPVARVMVLCRSPRSRSSARAGLNTSRGPLRLSRACSSADQNISGKDSPESASSPAWRKRFGARAVFFPSPFTFTGFILALIPASLLTDYFILTLWLSCLVGGIFLSIIFIKRSAQKQGPELLF